MMKFTAKHILYGFLILFFLATFYSAVSDSFQESKDLALSELVGKVNAGEVEEIIVEGSVLDIKLRDGSRFASKKEEGSSLTDTLINYGVPAAQLSTFKHTEKDPSGLSVKIGAPV